MRRRGKRRVTHPSEKRFPEHGTGMTLKGCDFRECGVGGKGRWWAGSAAHRRNPLFSRRILERRFVHPNIHPDTRNGNGRERVATYGIDRPGATAHHAPMNAALDTCTGVRGAARGTGP